MFDVNYFSEATCCTVQSQTTEINRVRKDMYNDTASGLVEKHPLELPDPLGPVVHVQEKLFVPVKEYPDYNFVGRILGPRGLTAKQLEAETGCKIMVRGKSSMRDKKKEEQNRGKPNWEHLNEDLHVLITVEDTQGRAEMKMRRAVEEVKKLLVPAAEGEDNLKKMQLMELAILNGTYRDTNIKTHAPIFISPSLIQILPSLGNAEGEDNLKKMQLMELAILNGTYRDTNIKTRKTTL
ncbi:Protein quaking-A [Acipenser ruthenus]|uniref:Protein quaking-A n=1 Tax=Acipenser ruthenus TaxID=7906 RepID=A0A662YLQ7_ACIRT|nr:Protein quaking-A [Acipenser ruthenus]